MKVFLVSDDERGCADLGSATPEDGLAFLHKGERSLPGVLGSEDRGSHFGFDLHGFSFRSAQASSRRPADGLYRNRPVGGD
ncbi:hypothetical protein, partial [Phenylobacterium sp.]|uniref:hypothetical protein n=1 Tax=Phenylobacterium sp. TaxID=1871053 RepID=UPI0027351335